MSIFEQSTDDLNRKIKQLKTERTINAVLVGFTAGIFAFSIIKGGLGFGSFLALVVAYFFYQKRQQEQYIS